MGNCLHNKEPPTIPKMAPLTAEQIDLIKTTWAIPAANAVDSGEAILLAYFERYPKNQEKFLAFKNVPLLSLKGTPGFRTHAGRVALVLNEAIETLDKDNYQQELEILWTKIGETHNKRKISRRAFNELRIVLTDILIQVCKLNDAQKEAWNILLDTIYQILFQKIDTLTYE